MVAHELSEKDGSNRGKVADDLLSVQPTAHQRDFADMTIHRFATSYRSRLSKVPHDMSSMTF
jgi:hypothetical protein